MSPFNRTPRHEAATRDRGARARAHLARARERERKQLARRNRERSRARTRGGQPSPWLRVRPAVRILAAVLFGVLLASVLRERSFEWLGTELAAVDTIAVQGHARLTSAQVAAATAIDRGSQLADVDPEAVEARLLALPWVAEADVLRLPPSTLLVRVREREARALLTQASGENRLVDARGTPFAGSWIPTEEEPLPRIVGGEGLETDRPYGVLVEALEVIAGLEAAGADALVEPGRPMAVQLPGDPAEGGWILRGENEVWLGQQGLDDRLERLRTLIESDVLKERGPAPLRIDLRFAGQAVLTEIEPRTRG